jgi:hypothetical protein
VSRSPTSWRADGKAIGGGFRACSIAFDLRLRLDSSKKWLYSEAFALPLPDLFTIIKFATKATESLVGIFGQGSRQNDA